MFAVGRDRSAGYYITALMIQGSTLVQRLHPLPTSLLVLTVPTPLTDPQSRGILSLFYNPHFDSAAAQHGSRSSGWWPTMRLQLPLTLLTFLVSASSASQPYHRHAGHGPRIPSKAASVQYDSDAELHAPKHGGQSVLGGMMHRMFKGMWRS